MKNKRKRINLAEIDTSDHPEECKCDVCIYKRAKYETEFLDEHDH